MRGTVAALLIMALGFLVGAVAGDWIWGSIAMVVLFAATIRFWMRSSFAIDGTRIRAAFPLGMAEATWTDVKSARLAPRGMLLSMRAGVRPRAIAIDISGLDGPRVLELRQLVRERVGDVESAVPAPAPAATGGTPHE